MPCPDKGLYHAFLPDSTQVESVQINQETVNPKEKIGPEDFELLKVLGKGGYGKVRQMCALAVNIGLGFQTNFCSHRILWV